MTLEEIRRALGQPVARFVARPLSRTGISPNMVTILGFLMSIGVAWVLGAGHLFLGGFLVLVSGAFDMVDGALARLKGEPSEFGALLDSTLDRFSEAAILLGLLAYYSNHGSLRHVMLVGAVLVGSMMTSYVRARSEGLGLKDKVGVFTRPERVILLAIGLIFGWLVVVLWIMAVVTNFIAWQRLAHFWRESKK